MLLVWGARLVQKRQQPGSSTRRQGFFTIRVTLTESSYPSHITRTVLSESRFPGVLFPPRCLVLALSLVSHHCTSPGTSPRLLQLCPHSPRRLPAVRRRLLSSPVPAWAPARPRPATPAWFSQWPAGVTGPPSGTGSEAPLRRCRFRSRS